jgi:apolipoprotein D and lipocalin family protein
MKKGTLTAAIAAAFLTACAAFPPPPRANENVPQPRKPVDLQSYLGLWYEQARFDHSFERGCENVTALYEQRDDGLVAVTNSCVKKSGETKTTEGTAEVTDGPAKLKVSFFGPFSGDYWILDYADDYSWSIVGEPSGRYLWFLTRDRQVGQETMDMLRQKASAMGYDLDGLIRVEHSSVQQ